MENMTGKQEMEKRQKLTEDYLGFSTGSLLGMYAGAKARLWRLSIELEVYCNKMGGRRKSSITITRKEEERVAEKIKESNKDCTREEILARYVDTEIEEIKTDIEIEELRKRIIERTGRIG